MIDVVRRPRRLVPVLVGDCVVLTAVLSVGIVRHGGLGRLGDVADVAGTVAPFLLGWLIVAPLVGAYGETALSDRRSGVGLGVLAWIGAAVVGSGVRATPLFDGGATPVFLAVVAATGGVAMAVWRFLSHALSG